MEARSTGEHDERSGERIERFTKGLRSIMTTILPKGASSTPNDAPAVDRPRSSPAHEKRTSGYYLLPDDWPWNVRGHDLTVDQVYSVLERFTEPAQLEVEAPNDSTTVEEADEVQVKPTNRADGPTEGESK